MSLSHRDQKHLWHPLTQHKLQPKALPIIRAEGVYLYDEQGRSYIDAISSWYTAVYGHRHPHIIAAVTQQMQTLDHVIFTGFTHEPAVILSEKLIKILPSNQDKLFFSDNGSTATEVGLKMALQYHHNQGHQRNVIIAFEEGFHGDTFGAMSVSGLSVYNGPFEKLFIEVNRIPTPDGMNNEAVVERFCQIVSQGNVAAFIYEPLVQGAAAMKIYDAKLLHTLLQICKNENVLTIADEVFTGFGKTGRHFASENIETYPDIICMSKALTAGLLPMGVTSCSKHIYEAFYDDDLSKGFFHGHTYTANPLACSVAIAGIDLLISKEIQQNKTAINKTYRDDFSDRMANHSKITNVRYLGDIFAFDFKVSMSRYGSMRNKLFDYFMSKGVFLRPLGNTVYIVPPYTISSEELTYVFEVIERAVEDLF